MNKVIATTTGLLVLVTALLGTGCAPMPYQGSYGAETEIIIVYEPVPYPVPVPVPYPVPGEVGGYEPLPERHSPLTKPRNPGNPRVKTPRTDRSGEGPVIARGGEKPIRKPRHTDSRPSRKPGVRRR